MAERGLPDVIDALRRRWLLLAAVALPLFAGVVLYAESLPAAYDGVATVSFAPKTDNIGGDSLRLYLPRYISYVTSRETVDRIAQGNNFDPVALEKGANATIATDTSVLTIRVRLGDASRAAQAANLLADEVVTFSHKPDSIAIGEVVARAVAARGPASPPRRLFEVAGLAAALLVGAAVAFIVERGRPRARTSIEVAAVTGFPVLGRVPVARALRTHPEQALADPAVGAAVRTLRTQVERESRNKPINVLLMTSPQSGDGKTTVAASYAAAVARLGARVLLIDGDLRRPRVFQVFDMSGAKGLAALLRGKVSFAEAVQSGGVDGLYVLPTDADPEAGDLLAKGFGAVVATAKESYDVVIIDAPPILGADDARTLATLAEAVLFVVLSGTPVPVLAEAAAALESLRVRVLGCVLNRYRTRGVVYGSYGAYGAEAPR